MPELHTAACDEHLDSALRYLVPMGESRPLRVQRVEPANKHHQCACGEWADWYIRTIKQIDPPHTGHQDPPHPGRAGHYAQDFGG
jgi:hypothetical protein